jgi:hypothetical protein
MLRNEELFFHMDSLHKFAISRQHFSGNFSSPVQATLSSVFPSTLFSILCPTTFPISCSVSKVIQTGSQVSISRLAPNILKKGFARFEFSLLLFFLAAARILFYRLQEFCFYRCENWTSHVYFFLFTRDITLGDRAYFHVDFRGNFDNSYSDYVFGCF